MFQSLGLNHPRFNSWRRWFAVAFAAVVVVGNVSFPIMVLAGVIDEDNREPVEQTRRGRQGRRRPRRWPEVPGSRRGMTVTGPDILEAQVPAGPIEKRWDDRKFNMKLVAPHNRRSFTVIVVGTGLAGAAAAATLGELGYHVKCFTFHDSPRRAHSIAAQGGINAAKNYRGDGDSIFRLFYDTVKGGDYRARESNVYRLAAAVASTSSTSASPRASPSPGSTAAPRQPRSFGGAQVARTFYARGQTGQQLLLGAYQALMRQVVGRARSSCTRVRRCSSWW